MRWPAAFAAGLLASAFALGADAYEFHLRQLTFDGLTENGIAMSGSVAGWVSCVPDPLDEYDPLTCEIRVFDANAGGMPFSITDNAVEDECVAIHQRMVAFRRAIGAGQVILRDLDAGEAIVSSAGIDPVFYGCPQLSATRIVWLRGGQVVVYDRSLGTERVVGAGASYPDLDGDFVVWQEGEGDASEVWFLDASSASNLPQRLTNNTYSDERPTVASVRTLAGFPDSASVAWYRFVDGHYEIAAWSGSTTAITPMASRNHYFPVVTAYAPSLVALEQPAIAWTPTDPLEVLYCTTCNGDPANVLGLPASDPFLAGAPFTNLDDIQGGWVVFSRIFPAPASQFDLGFFEITSRVVTPITDDPELDDAGVLGFRSVPPVGPVVVFRRSVGDQNQIFVAPEPGAGGAVLSAAAALAWLAGAHRRAARWPARAPIARRRG